MGKFDISDIKKHPKKNLLDPDKNNSKKTRPRKTTGAAKQKKRIGRPPISKDKRLIKKITVNFTETELNRLEVLADKNMGVPLPMLVRQLLKKDGYI